MRIIEMPKTAAWHWNSDPSAAAGHYIPEGGVGRGHKEIDCPACRLGTLVPDKSGSMKCIDCGESFTTDELLSRGVVDSRRASGRSGSLLKASWQYEKPRLWVPENKQETAFKSALRGVIRNLDSMAETALPLSGEIPSIGERRRALNGMYRLVLRTIRKFVSYEPEMRRIVDDNDIPDAIDRLWDPDPAKRKFVFHEVASKCRSLARWLEDYFASRRTA